MARHLYLAHPSDGSERHERPIRVAIAVYHAMMRRGLRLLLEAEQGIDVVAVASDTSTIEQEVEHCRADVLVLDLRVARGASVEAIRNFRALAPGAAIVALTMDESPVFAQQALEAGALGFVLKDRADADLPEAVRRAARGESYESPRVGLRAPRDPA